MKSDREVTETRCEEVPKLLFTKEFLVKKDKFKSNATSCLGFLKDGCSWPFCDACGKNARCI